MKTTHIRAYGKVNLGLDITGTRPDGYHFVKMILQTVNIYDDIQVSLDCDEETEEPYRIIIRCDNPEVPADERNLAYKAARLILERYNLTGTITITIVKRIPMAAGMAGGSADAAAVINALNELYELDMNQAEKDDIAVKLGADVPFCLRRGAYLAEGIGEILTEISGLPHCYMVIIKPDFGISTVEAYRAYDEYINRYGDSEGMHPDVDALAEALKRQRLGDIAAQMGNVLELVALEEHPELRRIKDRLEAEGAAGVLMSGSGPTVFGLFEEEADAQRALENFGEGNYGKFKIEF